MNETWTERQRYQIGMVYALLARLLPVEGRDYTVQFDFNRADGRPNISMTGHTDIGKQWVEYCMKYMQQHGVNYARNEPAMVSASTAQVNPQPTTQIL